MSAPVLTKEQRRRLAEAPVFYAEDVDGRDNKFVGVPKVDRDAIVAHIDAMEAERDALAASVRALRAGMEAWARDEDGIHPDAFVAYNSAGLMLGVAPKDDASGALNG